MWASAPTNLLSPLLKGVDGEAVGGIPKEETKRIPPPTLRVGPPPFNKGGKKDHSFLLYRRHPNLLSPLSKAIPLSGEMSAMRTKGLPSHGVLCRGRVSRPVSKTRKQRMRAADSRPYLTPFDKGGKKDRCFPRGGKHPKILDPLVKGGRRRSRRGDSLRINKKNPSTNATRRSPSLKVNCPKGTREAGLGR